MKRCELIDLGRNPDDGVSADIFRLTAAFFLPSGLKSGAESGQGSADSEAGTRSAPI